MKVLLFSTTVFVVLCFHGHSNDGEELLVAITNDPKYSNQGKLTDIVIECLANPKDIEESEKWHPYSEKFLAPMTTIIEVAYENLKVPDGKPVYSKPTKYVKEKLSDPFSPRPDFRGADLRRLNENLWCWEVYFGLLPDLSNPQPLIRGGDLILSVKVLPNGGKIVAKERKMTREERIIYGLDLDPQASDPFAP